MSQSAEHVAVIMDGNGRWANERILPRYHGHSAGVKAVERTINSAVKNKIKYLTLFAFSSENTLRPQTEISFLKKLFYKNITERLNELHENNIKINFIGELSYFSGELNSKMHDAQELTKNNTGLVFTVALNYGGRWDIIQACKKIVASGIKADDINEEILTSHLSTAGLPEPDLLIRTSGEQRISNFLIWQFAYTELFFINKYWPDFTEADFEEALKFYSGCDRRFGRARDLVAEQ